MNRSKHHKCIFAPGILVASPSDAYVLKLDFFRSQESSAIQGLFCSVDKFGFFFAWREEDKVPKMLFCPFARAVLKKFHMPGQC